MGQHTWFACLSFETEAHYIAQAGLEFSRSLTCAWSVRLKLMRFITFSYFFFFLALKGCGVGVMACWVKGLATEA